MQFWKRNSYVWNATLRCPYLLLNLAKLICRPRAGVRHFSQYVGLLFAPSIEGSKGSFGMCAKATCPVGQL